MLLVSIDGMNITTIEGLGCKKDGFHSIQKVSKVQSTKFKIMVQLIDKSSLYKVSFAKNDVLAAKMDKSHRIHKLKRGLALGNLEKQAVQIKMKDVNGQLYETIATIWAVTEKFIILKSGIAIPIQSIVDVELC